MASSACTVPPKRRRSASLSLAPCMSPSLPAKPPAGSNEHAALGCGHLPGALPYAATPCRVESSQPWQQVVAGHRTACAINNTGGLFCCELCVCAGPALGPALALLVATRFNTAWVPYASQARPKVESCQRWYSKPAILAALEPLVVAGGALAGVNGGADGPLFATPQHVEGAADVQRVAIGVQQTCVLRRDTSGTVVPCPTELHLWARCPAVIGRAAPVGTQGYRPQALCHQTCKWPAGAHGVCSQLGTYPVPPPDITAAVACFAAGECPPKLRKVPGNVSWTDITVGRDHQCGLTIDGQGERYRAVQGWAGLWSLPGGGRSCAHLGPMQQASVACIVFQLGA